MLRVFKIEMNEEILSLACGFVPERYVRHAAQAKKRRENLIRGILSSRKLPVEGLDDLTIELLLQEVAALDTNNFTGSVGAGEREGRVYSDLVSRRHYRLSHGIGRSGNINDMQPKAAGSSLIAQLTRLFVLELVKLSGIVEAKSCIVLPVATGMAHVLTLLALRQRRPEARYVIWPRMDQASVLKAIAAAGFIPIVIDNELENQQAVRTNLENFRNKVEEIGAENVAAVITTTR